jgi:predicted house-cleaning noncanonical NTP pyrophosphatase (MazG superfamily)
MAWGRIALGKLVRDKIPDIITASGRGAVVHRLDHAAYLAALHAKLLEEAAELRRARSRADVTDEAADVLEVLIAIAEAHGCSFASIIETADSERVERGGFDNRLWLERIDPDNP